MTLVPRFDDGRSRVWDTHGRSHDEDAQLPPNQWDGRTVVTASRKEVKIDEVFTDHRKSRPSCPACQALLPIWMRPH